MTQTLSVYQYISVLPASLEAQMVKCLPALWDTWVRSLGQEDPLEKKMTTNSSILAWEIPRTEEFVLIAWQATIHRVTKNS